MKRNAIIVAVLSAMLAGRAAAAQTVRGEVVEPTGGGVAGARVILVNAAGQRIGAALTGPDGAFQVTAPAAGSYVLRVERIGFASTTTRVQLTAGEVLRQRIVSGSNPVVLAGVTASGAGPRCEVRPDSGRMTATLWEEARKALELANGTDAEQRYRYQIRTTVRDIGGPGMLVRDQQVATVAGSSVQPFVSQALPRLANGFVQTFGDSVAFYAPDATLLLSGEFLGTHCFRITDAPDADSVIGLAFEPVRGRYLSDVKGVLWLNRKTAELRSMDYEYTNPPLRGRRGVPGGRVEFKRLPNAAWIVSRWLVRMPYQEIQTTRDPNRAPPPPTVAIREKVAEVVDVLTRTGRRIDMEPPAYARLEGVVFDSTRARALAGARVFLSGTTHEAVTDSGGRFVFANIREGTYALAYTAARLDTLGYVALPQPVTLAANAVERRELAVPAGAGAGRAPVGRLAAATARGDSTVRLRPVNAVANRSRTLEAAGFYRRRQQGRGVFMTDSAFNRNTPLENVLRRVTGVRVIRFVPPSADGRRLPVGPPPETRVISGRSGVTSLSLSENQDPADRFCYVPIVVDGVLVVRGNADQGNDIGQVSLEHAVAVEIYRTGTEVPPEFGGIVNGCGLIAIWTEDGPRGSRAQAPQRATATRATAARATRDAAAAPRDQAAPQGTTPPAAAAPTAPAGPVAAAESPGGAVELQPVRAVGASNRTLEDAGFYRRRQRGRGVFLTDSAFNRNAHLGTVLRHITGIRVIRYVPPTDRDTRGAVAIPRSSPGADQPSAHGGPTETRVVSGRASVSSLALSDTAGAASMACFVPVFVDGVEVIHGTPDQGNDINQVPLERAIAIEVYRSGAEVPAEFGGMSNGCGLIAVWTEAGPRRARTTNSGTR